VKKQIMALVIFIALVMGCASANNTVETKAQNSLESNTVTAAGVDEWKLIEVYVNGKDTLFRRETLPKETGNFFTVNFGGEIVSGTGAPNRYTAPYTFGENQAVSIKLIRSTMMATFLEPEKLKEHEFFVYMQNAYSRKQTNERLELLSKTQDGGEVRLVFSR